MAPLARLSSSESKAMLPRSQSIAVGFALIIGCAIANKPLAAAPADVHPTRVIHCEDIDDHRATVVTGVAMTRDAKVIAAATDDHRVLMWDATSGELNGHMD